MAPLSNSSKNMKVILAIVVLFLGWLIASMIPRNEAPWDKTSSSFLVRRPVTRGGDGEHAADNSDYREIWDKEKDNWDPEKKNVTIEYDSRFFGSEGISSPELSEQAGTPSKGELAKDEVRDWADEIKVDSDDLPDVQVGARPRWDDDTPFDSPAIEAEQLAPPLESLENDWAVETPADTGSVADAEQQPTEPANVLPETGVTENTIPPAEAPAAETSTAESQPEPEEDAALIAQAPALVPEQPQTNPTREVEPLPVPDVVPVELAPRAETLPLSETSDTPPAAETPVAISTETPRVSETPEASDRLYALPTKRPAQQNVEAPDAAKVSSTESGNSSEELLPFKTLVPSGASQVVTVDKSTSVDQGVISQVSADVPSGQPESTTTAYYEQPVPVETAKPMAISVYMAGAGENWEGIAAKFGLSAEESIRFAEMNSFRINADRTVTEGMKLMLPKH
ncbi:MAG: hypothetical protein ACOX6D_06880 [Thermoguttaceae bacterium]|jgi:hypothetical protein